MSALTIGISLKLYFGRRRTVEWCRAVADIAPVCLGQIAGFGPRSYELAIRALVTELRECAVDEA